MLEISFTSRNHYLWSEQSGVREVERSAAHKDRKRRCDHTNSVKEYEWFAELIEEKLQQKSNWKLIFNSLPKFLSSPDWLLMEDTELHNPKYYSYNYD